MRDDVMGRAWFGLNALVVAVGIVVQLFATADSEGGFFTGSAAVLNVFCYFTIQSNLILGVTTAGLAIGATLGSPTLRVLRLVGVVGIALTFVVFHAVLRDLQDLTGQAAFADVLLHTVSPILGVGGWLLFGPRRRTSVTVVAGSAGFVVAWGLFTMIRGAVVRHGERHFYPYPFMDPTDHGYLRVAVNLTIVLAVFVALALAAHAVDGALARRSSSTSRGVLQDL